MQGIDPRASSGSTKNLERVEILRRWGVGSGGAHQLNIGTGPKAQFFPNLEAARGIAALMVALFHIGQAYFFNSAGLQRTLIAPSAKTLEFTWSDQLFRILGNGHGAVVLFFVLSGFVLTLVLQQGAERGGTKATLFFLARICRIYPAVITSIVIFVALFFFTGLSLTSPEQYSPWIIFLNGLLISTTIDGVMWSLQLELIAAPVIFLVWLAWMRFGNKALTITFAILVILSFTRTWNHLIGPPAAFGQLHAFIAGMAAFLCGQKIVDRLHRPVLWLTGMIVGFALSRAVIGWSSNWTVLSETLFGAATVALLAFGKFNSREGRISGLARFFGRISFSFYLLHPLTLTLFDSAAPTLTTMVNAGIHPLVIATTAFICSVAAVTPLAWLQYQYIERPFIKLGRGLRFDLRTAIQPA
jgi:peptidoglycan/LPS O-acetylase OafA/YrhL